MPAFSPRPPEPTASTGRNSPSRRRAPGSSSASSRPTRPIRSAGSMCGCPIGRGRASPARCGSRGRRSRRSIHFSSNASIPSPRSASWAGRRPTARESSPSPMPAPPTPPGRAPALGARRASRRSMASRSSRWCNWPTTSTPIRGSTCRHGPTTDMSGPSPRPFATGSSRGARCMSNGQTRSGTGDGDLTEPGMSTRSPCAPNTPASTTGRSPAARRSEISTSGAMSLPGRRRGWSVWRPARRPTNGSSTGSPRRWGDRLTSSPSPPTSSPPTSSARRTPPRRLSTRSSPTAAPPSTRRSTGRDATKPLPTPGRRRSAAPSASSPTKGAFISTAVAAPPSKPFMTPQTTGGWETSTGSISRGSPPPG